MLQKFYKPAQGLSLLDETLQPWHAEQQPVGNLILTASRQPNPRTSSPSKNQFSRHSRTPQLSIRSTCSPRRNTPSTQSQTARSFLEEANHSIFQTRKVPHSIPVSQGYGPSNRTFLQSRHRIQHSEQFSITLEPINLSLIITPKEDHRQPIPPRSKDTTSYLRFQSQRMQQTPDRLSVNGKTMKQKSHEENSRFQRMLKLNYSIRKRKARVSPNTLHFESIDHEKIEKQGSLPTRQTLPVSRAFIKSKNGALNRVKIHQKASESKKYRQSIHSFQRG